MVDVVACVTILLLAMPALPVQALTENDCIQLNSGTCRLTCDSGEQEIGPCSDNIIYGTCCSKASLQPGQSAQSSTVQNSNCATGPNGCCVTTIAPGEPGGPNNRLMGSIRKESCPAPTGDIYYGDCYCTGSHGETGPYPDPLSYAACVAKCAENPDDGLTILNTKGVGQYKPKAGTTGGNASTEQFVNALCFTIDQCSSSDYGGSSSAFIPDSSCPTGQGKCLAPEPTITLSSPVLGVTSVTGFPRYVVLMFQYMLSIVVIAAAVMFVYGGFKYIVGSSAGDLGGAKETMTNAVIGLFLSFAAYTLLNTLNPALTNYSKLNIYLINKLEFSTLEWCSDYKLKSGKQFADAGDPAGSTPYSTYTAPFPVTPDLTLCGKSYYPEGYNGKTCKGQACTEKGEVCVACDKGGCPVGATVISACVKAAIAGSISVSDGRTPSDLYLIAVCNGIDPPKDSATVAAAVPKYKAMQLSTGTSGSSFKYAGSISDLNELQDACKNAGGFRGAVFGVKYKDTATVLAGAVTGAVNSNTGTCTYSNSVINGLCKAGSVIASTVGGAATNVITLDDVAIVTKANCSGGAAYFGGYADGTSDTFGNMQTALYCGYRVTPGTSATGRVFATGNTGTFNTGPSLYTTDELQKAFSGTGDAIQCNFSLNNATAPSDPGTTLEAGCKSGWTPT